MGSVDFVQQHTTRLPSGKLALDDADNNPNNGIQPTGTALVDFVELGLPDKRRLLGKMTSPSDVGMRRSLLRMRGRLYDASARATKKKQGFEERVSFYAHLTAYTYLMKKHIAEFGQGTAWSEEQLEDAISTMLDALNVGDDPVVFTNELETFSRDPAVRGFIKQLNAALLVAAAPLKGEVRNINLWAMTVKHAGGDESKASAWLAVLFQDLNSNLHTAHIADRQFSLQLATAIQLIKALPVAQLQLYPPTTEAVDRDFYHYYVPRYLASKMVKEGSTPQIAFLATLMMTVEYEYASLLSRDLAGQGSSSKLRHFFSTRSGLKMPLRQLKVAPADRLDDEKDIYMGYRGSLAGAGLPVRPYSFARLQASIEEDPDRAIRDIFRRAGH